MLHKEKKDSSADSNKLSRVLDELSEIYKQLTVAIPHREYVTGIDGSYKKGGPRRRGSDSIPIHIATADEQKKFKNQFPTCVKALEKVGSTFQKHLFYMSSEESKKNEHSYLYRFSPRAMGCFVQCLYSGNHKPAEELVMLYSLMGLLVPPSLPSIKRQKLDASKSCSDLSADQLKKIFLKINELLKNKMILPLARTLSQEAANNKTMLQSFTILMNPTMQKIMFSYFGENIFCELQKGFTPNQRFLLSLWADAVMALVGEQPGVSRLVSLIKYKILPSIDQQMVNKVYDPANFNSEEMSFIQTVYHCLCSEPVRHEIIQALKNTTATGKNVEGIFCENEDLYGVFTSNNYPDYITDPCARMRSIFFKLEQQDLYFLSSSMKILKLHHGDMQEKENSERPRNIMKDEKQEDDTPKERPSSQMLALWNLRVRYLGKILVPSSFFETPLKNHGLFTNKRIVDMVVDYLGVIFDTDTVNKILAEAANETEEISLTPAASSPFSISKYLLGC